MKDFQSAPGFIKTLYKFNRTPIPPNVDGFISLIYHYSKSSMVILDRLAFTKKTFPSRYECREWTNFESAKDIMFDKYCKIHLFKFSATSHELVMSPY